MVARRSPSSSSRKKPVDFDELVAQAEQHAVRGWDFEWILKKGRFVETALPWDYAALVVRLAHQSPDLLDLGTGGGERLEAFSYRPALTVATESYAPNVPIAYRRLRPLGVHLVHTWAALDNVLQGESSPIGRLPFRDRSFHLVIDRNEAYVPSEVARVLSRGGIFLTEQSGTSEVQSLHRLFDIPLRHVKAPFWTLGLASQRLAQVGLRVVGSSEAHFEMKFGDVGALVWYLRMVPWAVPGFSVKRHRDALLRIHENIQVSGPLRVPRYGFWLEAQRRS